jgi:hypothetical protein
MASTYLAVYAAAYGLYGSVVPQPGYSQPAPTELAEDNATKRLSFKRRAGVAGDAYRVQYKGGAWQMLADLRNPNEYSNFLVGNRAYAAGEVQLAEFDSSGAQVSPAAATTKAYTQDAAVPTALAYAGDSVGDESGNLTDADPSLADATQPSRLAALLNRQVNTLYSCTGAQGITISQMLSANNIANETAPNRFQGRPAKGAFFEFINEACKNGTPIDDILEKNYQFVDAQRPAGIISDFLLVGPTDQVEPILMDDGVTPMPYTWSQLKARVYQQVPLTMAGRVEGFVSLEHCPFIGVDGAALRGVKNGTYRNGRHPGSGADGTGGGRLVLASRIAAAVLAYDGLLADDDFTATASVVVSGNTVYFDRGGSKWALMMSLDNGASWHITAEFYQDDVANATMLIANVAAPNLVTTRTYSVASGFQPETVAHARAVYAPDFNYATFISQPLIDKAVVALKATGYLDQMLVCLLPGGGILNFDDNTGNPKAIKLLGYGTTRAAESQGRVYYYLPDTHVLDFNQATGSGDFGMRVTPEAPITSDWVLVLDLDLTAEGFQGHATLNANEVGIYSTPGQLYLTEAGAFVTAGIPISDGHAFFILRNAGGQLSLRTAGTAYQATSNFSYSNSLDYATLGAGFNASSRSKQRGAYVFPGGITETAINQFIAAL